MQPRVGYTTWLYAITRILSCHMFAARMWIARREESMDIDTLSSVLVGLMDDHCTVLCVLYGVYVSLYMFPLEMEILWCSRRPDVIISYTPALLPRTRFWVSDADSY